MDPVSMGDGYTLVETLTDDLTFLCADASSNLVVLKRLEDDCLHRNQLHPSIKERLACVRELPHPRLATLRGVERWRENAFLIWCFLDGEIWDQAVARRDQHVLNHAAALAMAVDALHERGIVHGNLHGRNVIVTPDGQVWLTHVSPYLYTDVTADTIAVAQLIEPLIENLPALTVSRGCDLLNRFRSGEIKLRELARSLASLHSPEVATTDIESVPVERRYRRSSLISAILAALIGGSVWFGFRSYGVKQSIPRATTFPSLKFDSKP